jgi:hypothetical protein
MVTTEKCFIMVDGTEFYSHFGEEPIGDWVAAEIKLIDEHSDVPSLGAQRWSYRLLEVLRDEEDFDYTFAALLSRVFTKGFEAGEKGREALPNWHTASEEKKKDASGAD